MEFNKLEISHTDDEFLFKLNGTEMTHVKDYTLKNSGRGLTELTVNLYVEPTTIVIDFKDRRYA